jgi:hypothetical protein
MEQEVITLRRFGGMITNPQAEDIPDEMAIFAKNVDPMTEGGVLRGIPTKGAEYLADTSHLPNIYEADWIKYERSNQALTVKTHSTHPSNPIVITVTVAHNLVSGDKVVIAEVNPIVANGTWRITVIDSITFSIPTATTGDYVSGGTVTYTGGTKWDLVYIDTAANDITVVEDFYNNPTQADSIYRILLDLVTANIVPRCVKTFNNMTQVGNGVDDKANVIFRLLEEKKFFNDIVTKSPGYNTESAGDQVEKGECYNAPVGQYGSYNAENAILTLVSGTGYFLPHILYKWAISIVYDGLQESNLVEGASDYQGSNSKKALITIIATGLTTVWALDRRITAIKLYRAESSDTSEGNLGLYRLVKILNINKGDGIDGTVDPAVTTTAITLTDTRLNMEVNKYIGEWISCGGSTLVVTGNTSDTFTGAFWSGGTPASGLAWRIYHYREWFNSGNDYQINYDDWGGYEAGGATYEEETGISQTLEFQSIRYALNEVGGGYHWVTNGKPEGEIDDWQRHIFRSKKFRPNMFDWVNDRLVLPEIPIALRWYNNYLYAFSENTTYKINPELFAIEDSFFGAGCLNRQAVTTTEFGMFWCDANNAYVMQGDQIDILSDLISSTPRTTGTVGWKDFIVATTGSILARTITLSETYRRMILFIGVTNTSYFGAFAYYLPTKEWFFLSLGAIPISSTAGAFNGKDGEIYISTNVAPYLTRCFAGATAETTLWISKEFTLGEPSQNKSWHKIKWDASVETPAISYATDGTDVGSGTSAGNGTLINIYKKTMQIKAVTNTTAKLDSLDIIVRRLDGKR